MKLNTSTACNLVGLGFFGIVTLIEIALFGSIFDTFINHWGRALIVAGTIILFNIFLWFFAIKYYQTSQSVKNNTDT